MKRIAVTGGVATGKSTVLAAFTAAGVPTVDLDAICRDLTAQGSPVLKQIKAAFGEEYVIGGALNRPALRRLISREPASRARLNAILHPLVWAEMERRLEGLAAQGHPVAAVEVPLLYETGEAARFDAVVLASCPPGTALCRLMARSRLGHEDAQALIRAQLPLEDKAKLADHVVDTAGSREEVARQVERILHKLGVAPSQSA